MSNLELGIAKLVEIKDDKGGALIEIRDHLIDLYNKMGLTLLKRHIVYEDMLLKQESEW